eukprot:5696542-Prorocentrum_lima.AAC.1
MHGGGPVGCCSLFSGCAWAVQIWCCGVHGLADDPTCATGMNGSVGEMLGSSCAGPETGVLA